MGTKTILSISIVSAIPTDSSNTGATNLKSQFSRGVGRVGEKIPAMGRIVGTSLVFKSLEKLNLKQSRRKR